MHNKEELLKDQNGLTEKEFLDRYQPKDYPRPSVTVDMLLFTVDSRREAGKALPSQEMKILLIKRRNHPYIESWALPGGFVEIGENLDEAAKRELKEETHIENVYLEQLYTWGDVERDPRMRVISVSYLALVQREQCKEQAGDDAADAAWFTVRKTKLTQDSENGSTWLLSLENEEKQVRIQYLVTEQVKKNGVLGLTRSDVKPAEDSLFYLAFDHAKIINMAVDRIRNKTEYTPLLFNLLPQEFTLSQAQHVYEAMLGRSVSKPGFRKKFAPLVEECEKREEHVGYRPGQYYRYKPSGN